MCTDMRSLGRGYVRAWFGGFAVAVACAAWGASPSAQVDQTTQPRHSVGNPMASGLISLLKQEIRDSMKARQVDPEFQRFRAYSALKLDSTAGDQSGSEVTGNCRLQWYDALLRNPLEATGEAEKFTRQLHGALVDDSQGLEQVLILARAKMDLGPRDARRFADPTSPEKALELVEAALTGAQTGWAAALAPLSRSQIAELRSSLYSVFVGSNNQGHTLSDRGSGRRLCDLMERMDRRGLYSAADALVPLLSPALLEQLQALSDQRALKTEGSLKMAGATGTLVGKVVTPAGVIVIGGKGKNTYELDQMSGVSAVIDLGGDDVYREGTVGLERPVLVLIDLAGNDRYEGTRPGVQGGAMMGISMLVDRSGDDIYRAHDVAQGSGLCGVGILVDAGGKDYYIGVRRVQGHALGGLGVLVDRAGSDSYRAAMWAQGFGAPLGFGLLDDLDGEDHYYVGGLYYDSYPETPGYEGWGQGVGAGLRQVGNGGIGVLLDGGGNDQYEYDYLSHGGGYWLGIGFLRDFGGDDRRFGGTRKAFNGSARGETEFQRFACGFGCHYALGFCFDDQGDDTYGGTIMGLGFAWDDAVGVLCDFGGNDRYEATGGGTQGNGAQAGLGILFDYTGNDTYLGYGQGYASPSISYHPMPQCGGNFSFLIDYGGKDSYGCGAQDNSYNQRGASSGFLIDRPLVDEVAERASAHKSGRRGPDPLDPSHEPAPSQ